MGVIIANLSYCNADPSKPTQRSQIIADAAQCRNLIFRKLAPS
jgi:hypothetical protein